MSYKLSPEVEFGNIEYKKELLINLKSNIPILVYLCYDNEKN